MTFGYGVYKPKTTYAIMIRDKTLNYRELVDDFISFEYSKRYNQPGAWKLVMQFNSKGAQALLDAYSETDGSGNPVNKGLTGITVFRNRLYEFTGPVRYLEEKWSSEGHFLVASGPSDEGILAEKIILPPPQAFQTTYTTAEYYQSGSAEYVIKKMMTDHLGSGAPTSRQLYNLNIVPSTSRGANPVATKGRFQNLLREIQQICDLSDRKGFPLGFYLSQSGQEFVFDVFVPEDKGIIFSPELQNISSYSYIQEAPTGNIIIAGDGQTLTNRSFNYAGDEPSRKLWGDQEGFIDASKGDNLPDEIYKALADQAEQTTFDFDYVERPGTEYQNNWNVGDIVTVKITRRKYGRNSLEQFSDLIRAVNVSITTENGEQIKPIIGSRGVGKTLRLFDRTRNLEYRANDQERY